MLLRLTICISSQSNPIQHHNPSSPLLICIGERKIFDPFWSLRNAFLPSRLPTTTLLPLYSHSTLLYPTLLCCCCCCPPFQHMKMSTQDSSGGGYIEQVTTVTSSIAGYLKFPVLVSSVHFLSHNIWWSTGPRLFFISTFIHCTRTHE